MSENAVFLQRASNRAARDYNFIVQDADSGKRIDIFLTSKIKDLHSRSFYQRLINNKKVFLNNASVKPHRKLCVGDRVMVKIAQANEAGVTPEDIDFKIIYEDKDIIIIDKPSGLIVHPGAGNYSGTLVNALLNYTGNLSDVNPKRPGIVHRLDKETSGLIVVAKNNLTHLKLAKQFAARAVKKKYIAIVSGSLEFDQGVINLPIGRHKRDFRLLSVRFDSASRNAVTRYRVLKRFEDATIVELVPETGRTHQLRVHLAHLGHPILGDKKYGIADTRFSRLALHAKELKFFHPASNKVVRFRSSLPKEFSDFKKLKRS